MGALTKTTRENVTENLDLEVALKEETKSVVAQSEEGGAKVWALLCTLCAYTAREGKA